MRTFKIISCLVLFVSSSCGDYSVNTLATGEAVTALPEARLQTVLSHKQSGISYSDMDRDEALPWGPSGIHKVSNGYAISDGVGRKVIVLDENLAYVKAISLGDSLTNVLSVVQIGDDLAVLDDASQEPTVVMVAKDGSIKKLTIPKLHSSPPSGLLADDLGLILEYGGGEKLFRISGRGGLLTAEPTNGYRWGGHTFELDDLHDTYSHERILLIDQKPVNIRVQNHLGAAHLLGPSGDGGVFVLVEDVTISPVVNVEQTVWHVLLSGDIASVAKVPISERLIPVGHGVAIGKDYQPIALVTKYDTLEFWSLSKAEPSLLDKRPVKPLPSGTAADVAVSSSALVYAGGGCLTSAQMQSNALEYLNNNVNISAASIENNGSCTSRIKPRYLGGAGCYTSVSYGWGDWRKPADFNAAMLAGSKAGNINDGGYFLSCSYGIDCSGFVGRVWGIPDATTKPISTSNIKSTYARAMTPIPVMGDVFNKAGSHVVVFVSNATNGIYAYESTAKNNWDRVVYDYRSWSELAGYEALRSMASCF